VHTTIVVVVCNCKNVNGKLTSIFWPIANILYMELFVSAWVLYAFAIALYIFFCSIDSYKYIILIGNNLSSLFWDIHMRVGGTDFNNEQFFVIILAIFVLPTVWLKNLSLFSYILGFFITIVLYFTHFIFQIYLLTIITFALSWRNICINSCCIYLFWVGIIDQVDGYKPGEKTLDLSNIFVSIGLYSFYFVGHAVFPNIYSSMKEPSKFPLVLYI